MDKKLNHSIMLRSKLCNKFLKSRSNTDRNAYKKQRNLCVSLLRQNKKDYFETLDIKCYWQLNVLENSGTIFL